MSDLAKITFSMFDRKMRDNDLCKEIAGALSIILHEKFKKEYDIE